MIYSSVYAFRLIVRSFHEVGLQLRAEETLSGRSISPVFRNAIGSAAVPWRSPGTDIDELSGAHLALPNQTVGGRNDPRVFEIVDLHRVLRLASCAFC